MDLTNYFQDKKGMGVLATADAEGRVDVAVYASPHITAADTIAFIMRERISHKNLKSNPHAAYMFMEEGPGYKGKRLYLTKIREETNTTLIEQLRRKQPATYPSQDDSNKYLVHFQIDKVRPLVGDK